MPTIDTMVTEITKQGIEVISEQIINRLIDVLGFSGLFTYNDNLFLESDDLRQSNFDDSEDNKRSQNNRCTVKIIPGYNPLETTFDILSGKSMDTFINSTRWTSGEYPLFSDKRAGINIYEVDLPTSIELQFEIKLKSIELSDAFNMALFSRALTGGNVYDYNDINFSYGIPDKLIHMLYKMYKMQDDVTNEMTFQDYLKIGSNDSIKLMTNRSRLNRDFELVMQRSNVRVLGRLVYEGDKHETEDYNKVSNRYIINFSYFYQFAKPALLRMIYPIMIYNKLLEESYLNSPKNMRYGEGEHYFQDIAINNYFDTHNRAQINLDRSYPHVRYPYYDDWLRSPAMYADIINKYQTIFTGLLSVNISDTGEKSLSVDLVNEVFPMLDPKMVTEFTTVVKELNMDEHAYLTKGDMFRRLGIFDIAVFCNDAIVPFDKLTLNEEFVLTVNCNLDISRLYRVVISQIKDIRILNRLYIYYMLDHPDYYADFLAFHMTYLVENGFVKILYDPFIQQQSAEYYRRHVTAGIGLPSRAISINKFIVEICRPR
jgi:hypothetical protein